MHFYVKEHSMNQKKAVSKKRKEQLIVLNHEWIECSKGHKNSLTARYCWVCSEFIPQKRYMRLNNQI